MNKVRISKAYRGEEHVGWKKTVAGRSWFLWYGTSPSDEAKAIAIATALEAKWQLLKLSGASELSETDFEEAKDVALGRERMPQTAVTSPDVQQITLPSVALPVNPQSASKPEGPVRRWLFASIDEFISSTLNLMKADMSNADHVVNTRDRIVRAREATADTPLDGLQRKELEDWLNGISKLPSKENGRPLGAATIRNLVGAVRMALTKFVEWGWWTPPPLWERAFKQYTIKKLRSFAEKKRRKKKHPVHTVIEKRILWHLGTDFEKAMMALADWAGHTQNEIATLLLEEIIDEDGEMYIERDRNKTGVPGRWWIPPEAAAVVRRVVARTPSDPKTNPQGLAFLTPVGQPLVHRARTGRFTRSDYVGNKWTCLLRASSFYGVRPISFKFMRKGMSQAIRDATNKEISRAFLAHSDEDVQDDAYTSVCLSKVEAAVRDLYPKIRPMFEPIRAADWPEIIRELERQNGVQKANVPAAAA